MKNIEEIPRDPVIEDIWADDYSTPAGNFEGERKSKNNKKRKRQRTEYE